MKFLARFVCTKLTEGHLVPLAHFLVDLLLGVVAAHHASVLHGDSRPASKVVHEHIVELLSNV